MKNTKEMDMFGGKSKCFTYLVIVKDGSEIEQIKVVLEEKITTMKGVEILNARIAQIYRGDGTILSFYLLENEQLVEEKQSDETEMITTSWEIKKKDLTEFMV